MEDALARQQFYADGEASYQDALHTNAVFSGQSLRAGACCGWPAGKAAGGAAGCGKADDPGP
jgi:hypothetical protein